MTTSDTTLSETIFSIVPDKRFSISIDLREPQFWHCNNAPRSSTTEQVMFSIQKLLGRDEKFYDLLEASAQQADTSVHHLIGLLQKLEQHDTPENLEQFAHSRREDKRITQELTEQLSKTFVTPFEREDIQELASALYKIPKTVEKIGERILICPEDLAGQSFGKQVELLDQAAEMVLAMVKQLRPGIDARTAREMNAKLQGIEGDADKLELERLRDLFKGRSRREADYFSARPLRALGKSDRSLPRRGEHHRTGGAEILVANGPRAHAHFGHSGRCHFRIQQWLPRRGKRDRNRRLYASTYAAPGDRDGCILQSYRSVIWRCGCCHDRQRIGGHRGGHYDDCALCCASRLWLEHCHLVVGLTIKFKSRADRRTLRRRTRCRERQLVSNQMERRCVAEGCPAYDRVASCRLRVRRALHVFVAYRTASLHAAICSFAIWKTANLQRGLDGP